MSHLNKSDGAAILIWGAKSESPVMIAIHTPVEGNLGGLFTGFRDEKRFQKVSLLGRQGRNRMEKRIGMKRGKKGPQGVGACRGKKRKAGWSKNKRSEMVIGGRKTA